MLPIIYSDRFLDHDTGTWHPERPQRLTAIVEALQAADWSDRLQWQDPTPLEQRAVLPWVQQVHAPEHIALVRQIAQQGGGSLDPDTPISPQSYEIALLAVSAWLDGVDRALETGNPAFAIARPPGHHAEFDRGMGFCLFSNAAIAAHYALAQPNVNRVAILDWDVHHGNGTQSIVANNPNLAYCSLHEFPNYPGTGRADERGERGNLLNIPIAAGSTLPSYQHAFEEQAIPFLTQFHPDLIVVSAGYDANRDDPLAGVSLNPQDFGIFTRYLLKLTRCLVFGLEGGYDLNTLSQSVVATIASCLSERVRDE